jgi:hypothetical protein
MSPKKKIVAVTVLCGAVAAVILGASLLWYWRTESSPGWAPCCDVRENLATGGVKIIDRESGAVLFSHYDDSDIKPVQIEKKGSSEWIVTFKRR